MADLMEREKISHRLSRSVRAPRVSICLILLYYACHDALTILSQMTCSPEPDDILTVTEDGAIAVTTEPLVMFLARSCRRTDVLDGPNLNFEILSPQTKNTVLLRLAECLGVRYDEVSRTSRRVEFRTKISR
jgi:hypothetical protein